MMIMRSTLPQSRLYHRARRSDRRIHESPTSKECSLTLTLRLCKGPVRWIRRDRHSPLCSQAILESADWDEARAIDMLLGMSDPDYVPAEQPAAPVCA
jgi:hypothetical protein